MVDRRPRITRVASKQTDRHRPDAWTFISGMPLAAMTSVLILIVLLALVLVAAFLWIGRH
jgi:hypothetical protein